MIESVLYFKKPAEPKDPVAFRFQGRAYTIVPVEQSEQLPSKMTSVCDSEGYQKLLPDYFPLPRVYPVVVDLANQNIVRARILGLNPQFNLYNLNFFKEELTIDEARDYLNEKGGLTPKVLTRPDLKRRLNWSHLKVIEESVESGTIKYVLMSHVMTATDPKKSGIKKLELGYQQGVVPRLNGLNESTNRLAFALLFNVWYQGRKLEDVYEEVKNNQSEVSILDTESEHPIYQSMTQFRPLEIQVGVLNPTENRVSTEQTKFGRFLDHLQCNQEEIDYAVRQVIAPQLLRLKNSNVGNKQITAEQLAKTNLEALAAVTNKFANDHPFRTV